ncbi:MAG: hypothetical protein JJ863_15485 [Deltaproteobacteria bacterium]|nr:hypothetical protein [Deltaproteobacteria bacterium]
MVILPDGAVCGRSLTVGQYIWTHPFHGVRSGAPIYPFLGADEQDFVFGVEEDLLICVPPSSSPLHLGAGIREGNLLLNVPSDWREILWDYGNRPEYRDEERLRRTINVEPRLQTAGNRFRVVTGRGHTFEVDEGTALPCQQNSNRACHLGFIELDAAGSLVSAGQLVAPPAPSREVFELDGRTSRIESGELTIDLRSAASLDLAFLSAVPVACPERTAYTSWSARPYDDWQCPPAGLATLASDGEEQLTLQYRYAHGPSSRPSHLRVVLENRLNGVEVVVNAPCCGGDPDEALLARVPAVSEWDLSGSRPSEAALHIESEPGFAPFVSFLYSVESTDYFLAASVDGTGSLHVPSGELPMWNDTASYFGDAESIWIGVASLDGSATFGGTPHEVVVRRRVR